MFVPGIVPTGTMPIADSGAVMIYEDTFVRPRATLYYRSETVLNDSIVLARIFDENDPHDRVLCSASEQAPPVLNDSLGTRSGWEAAHIVKEENNQLDIVADPSRPAYLVLSDTYYSGWKCFVDGNEQKIYRVNYAMRGIVLASGFHRIEFRFEPLSFKIGSTLSLISLCSLLGSVLFMNLRSSRGQLK